MNPTNCLISLLQKPLLGAVFLSALMTAQLAHATDSVIQLTLNDPEGVYQKGEVPEVKISVSPQVLQDQEWDAELSWKEGWNGKSNPIRWNPAKEIFFTIPMDQPGLALVEARLKNRDSGEVVHKASVGALIRPKELEPTTIDPEDFDAFWQTTVAQWRKIPQKVIKTEVDSGVEGVKSWEVEIQLEGEVPVRGYLSIPEEEGKYPIQLSLHGAGFRSAGLSNTAHTAKRGFIAMDINAHGILNGQSKDYYEQEGERLKSFRRQGVRSRETWYFRTMFLRIVTANDFLTSLEEWDGKDLVLYGSSQGGAQVLAGAGLDERVTIIAASVPAMCDMSAALAGRKPGWPQTLPTVGDDESAKDVLKTLPYFDGVNFAKRTKAAAIVSVGHVDPTCPADGIYMMVNNLQGKEVKVLHRPAMAHSIPSEIHYAFRAFIKEQLAKN